MYRNEHLTLWSGNKRKWMTTVAAFLHPASKLHFRAVDVRQTRALGRLATCTLELFVMMIERTRRTYSTGKLYGILYLDLCIHK